MCANIKVILLNYQFANHKTLQYIGAKFTTTMEAELKHLNPLKMEEIISI